MIIVSVIFGGARVTGSSDVMAQTFAIEYTSEWQTDYRGNYDWLNLLKTSATLPLRQGLSFEASTLSTAKCGDTTLIDDLLTYSNIEAGNIPLTLARLGFGLNIGSASLFVGINNVNEDYFTSELTSLFTNSSCGISPTISCNYDIANYPMASWCIHYSQHSGNLSWQTSLYPGKGYYRLLGHNNVASLNIMRDGIFNISSIDYRLNGIYCILGCALHYGVCIGDEEREQAEAQKEAQTPPSEMRLSAAPWLLSEISLPYSLGLMAHASVSTVNNGCRGYAGIGIAYNGECIQPGISLNYATFTSTDEYDVEVCARIPMFGGNGYLQPALHIISTDSGTIQCVGLLRMSINY